MSKNNSKQQSAGRARLSKEEIRLNEEWVLPGERVGRLLGLHLSGFCPSFSYVDIERPTRMVQLPAWLVYRLDKAYGESVEPLKVEPEDTRETYSEKQNRILQALGSWAMGVTGSNEEGTEG